MSRSFLPAALLASAVCSSTPALAQYNNDCRSHNPTFDPPLYSDAECTNSATLICGGDGDGADNHDPIQKIPVGSGFLYVGFSTRVDTNGVRDDNVTTWVLELACGQSADVLIFGTGYGCHNAPEYTAGDDAARIDTIIRDVIGLTGTVKLAIVAPHSHADHMSPEVYHLLTGSFGYTFDKIYAHADEFANVKNIAGVAGCTGSSFTAAEKSGPTNIFKSIGRANDNCNAVQPGNDCETAWNFHSTVKHFNTTLGRTWFRGRDGHTRGGVDMVIDYLGVEATRYVIYGSATPCEVVDNNCFNDNSYVPALRMTPDCVAPRVLTGVVWRVAAHGDIALIMLPHPNPCPVPPP
ncbi:MAG: hypothetical protein ACKVWV_08325 [Planctomycetota bacterium]